MLTCSPETAALLAQPEPTECRIEWAVPGCGTGHGEWFDILFLPVLKQTAAWHERYIGLRGTHWVLTR